MKDTVSFQAAGMYVINMFTGIKAMHVQKTPKSPQKNSERSEVLSYIMTYIVLFFATGIYLVESRDNIPSMPHSIWLALVTMTTVGYGDLYPKSARGEALALGWDMGYIPIPNKALRNRGAIRQSLAIFCINPKCSGKLLCQIFT